MSLELFRRSLEGFLRESNDRGTVQWPDENAMRCVVEPSPHKTSMIPMITTSWFLKAFEVCLSETSVTATSGNRLKATRAYVKLGLHLWIGMVIFFVLVQRTMNFLFHTIPSNSFTWPFPRFMQRFGLLTVYTYCPKQYEKKRNTTANNHLFLPLFKVIFSMQF